MPLLPAPTYTPPPFLFNKHLQTIYPALLRRVRLAPARRERLLTADDDFLDLDWWQPAGQPRTRLTILCHGLEGDSRRPYVRGMARALLGRGWDVLAWNFRGCSGEPNRQLRFYHSGATDDLDAVVTHAANGGYTQIALVGFSLGGNLVLKYLGECGANGCPQLYRAVVFSVPCDLLSSSQQISRPENWVYAQRFLRALRRKVTRKATLMPDQISTAHLRSIRTIKDFDDHYTAPLHGFGRAVDYYRRCSSRFFLPDIRIPTLIVNAANDPFLPKACYPIEEVRDHPCVFLEIPTRGGHCGFAQSHPAREYWSETRTADFLQPDLPQSPRTSVAQASVGH